MVDGCVVLRNREEMAHLLVSNSYSNTNRLTETVYEIKAPLATFDTIDLDEDALNIKSNPVANCIPVKGRLTEDSLKTQQSSCDYKINNVDESSTKDPDIPTPNESSRDCKIDIKESENNSMEANSSENNAIAEGFESKLKLKGGKYKEKCTNVKYEKIGSMSDVSDYEKTENQQSSVKLNTGEQGYVSDSENSDLESGYVRCVYISATKAVLHSSANFHSNIKNTFRSQGDEIDSIDSDVTPLGSPQPRQPTIPKPLSKEEAALQSKRKAYEKRLERMQVTTSPIARPRSTSHISVHGLQEYAIITSPEKFQNKENLEKLKIKLPLEETNKCKSSKITHKSSGCSFNDSRDLFNEEHLFTHTKSAILLSGDDLNDQSPKRILVPPSLSSKIAPIRNAGNHCNDVFNLTYSQCCISSQNLVRKTSNINEKLVEDSHDDTQNWATFDEPFRIFINETKPDSGDAKVVKDNLMPTEYLSCKNNNDEDILTVKITYFGDKCTCDTKLETAINTTSEASIDKHCDKGDNSILNENDRGNRNVEDSESFC